MGGGLEHGPTASWRREGTKTERARQTHPTVVTRRARGCRPPGSKGDRRATSVPRASAGMSGADRLAGWTRDRV
jgi:hypothetical protein